MITPPTARKCIINRGRGSGITNISDIWKTTQAQVDEVQKLFLSTTTTDHWLNALTNSTIINQFVGVANGKLTFFLCPALFVQTNANLILASAGDNLMLPALITIPAEDFHRSVSSILPEINIAQCGLDHVAALDLNTVPSPMNENGYDRLNLGYDVVTTQGTTPQLT